MPSTSENDLPDRALQIRRGWDLVAAEYAEDRSGIFALAAEKLLKLLHPHPGAFMLDVGSGYGAVSLPATSQIGRRGLVIASDISISQLRIAKHNATDLGVRNAAFCQADAERLSFPDAAFDIITCALSLFQFLDMNRALAEMVRVLKNRGRIGFSNWGTGYFSPLADMQRALFREFGLRPLLVNPITFMPKKLRLTLESAGFIEVHLEADEVDICFSDPQAVWDFNMSMGPFSIMLHNQLSPQKRERLHKRYMEMASTVASHQGIRCTFHLLYALARKP